MATSGRNGTVKVGGQTIAVKGWRMVEPVAPRDESAMLAAVRAAPADATLRLAYADCLDESGQAVEAALQRVLAEPDSDSHRLHYADACERDGQAERAEFVRVQVALAGLAPDPSLPGNREALAELLAREDALVSHRTPRGEWFPVPPGFVLKFDRDRSAYGPAKAFVGRGFVCRLLCTAADWLAHADDILAAHPVRRVELTGAGRFPAASVPRGFRCRIGDRNRLVTPNDLVASAERTPKVTGLDPMRQLLWCVLGLEWPHIEFAAN